MRSLNRSTLNSRIGDFFDALKKKFVKIYAWGRYLSAEIKGWGLSKMLIRSHDDCASVRE